MSNTISRMSIGELIVSEVLTVPEAIVTGDVAATSVTSTGTVTGTTLVASTAVVLKDAAGDTLIASGTTVPGDVAGYAKGCLFIDTDVGDGTSGLYVNVGIPSSADFKLITNAA